MRRQRTTARPIFRGLAALGLGLALAAAPTAAARASVGAARAPDDHSRLPLGPLLERALLAEQVAHSPHRLALRAGVAQFGPLPPGDSGAASQSPGTASMVAASTASAQPAKAGRRFYGYLPFWTQASAKLHWQTLTQLAWFSAELNGDGSVGATHGWGGATAKALIAKAHSHGVQVTLCVTLFSQSKISAVLSTAEKRAALVKTLVDLVVAGDGDGINIDFEGLALADKAKMVSFISALTKAMHAAIPGSDVTLATPAVDWSGAWDYDALAEQSDGLFIMAYGLHWGGGAPGPQLPMASKGPWKHKTLGWILDDYFQWGKPANKHKFIVGMPLYGNAWASDSALPGAGALAKGKSVTYENAVIAAPKSGGWLWDADSQSTWYLDKDAGNWIQTWVDDQPAMALRVELVDQKDVMLGCWALGYADQSPEVWAMFESWRAKTKPGSGGSDAGDAAVDAGGADAGGADAGGGGVDASGDSGGGGQNDGGASDAEGDAAGGADAIAADVDDADLPKDTVVAADDVATIEAGGDDDDASLDDGSDASDGDGDGASDDDGASDAVTPVDGAPTPDGARAGDDALDGGGRAGNDGGSGATIGPGGAALAGSPSGCAIVAGRRSAPSTAPSPWLVVAIAALLVIGRRRSSAVMRP